MAKSNEAEKNSSSDKKASNTKTNKETPVATVVIKIGFHCEGCVHNIYKTVDRFKGVYEVVKMDREKEMVSVKGTMDVKALVEALKAKFKRSVEIVQPKKDTVKDGGEDSGKKKSGSGGQESAGNFVQVNCTGSGHWSIYGFVGEPAYICGSGYVAQPIYDNRKVGPPVYVHGGNNGCIYIPVSGFPVDMKFNDDNPNACSVM